MENTWQDDERAPLLYVYKSAPLQVINNKTTTQILKEFHDEQYATLNMNGAFDAYDYENFNKINYCNSLSSSEILSDYSSEDVSDVEYHIKDQEDSYECNHELHEYKNVYYI